MIQEINDHVKSHGYSEQADLGNFRLYMLKKFSDDESFFFTLSSNYNITYIALPNFLTAIYNRR